MHHYAKKPPKRGLHHRPPSSSDCAIHRHRRKTAEERFHTLARGWLAYPVTQMHALLPPKSGCRNVTLGCPIGAIHRHRRKTAEERFHTLARGWLAYPVTPMLAHLPPKSGCINIIPRLSLSRRRATALFRNPVRKAQRSVPGFSSTPTSACRRYATSPPSAVASPIVRHPSVCPIGAIHRHREKPPKSGLIC